MARFARILVLRLLRSNSYSQNLKMQYLIAHKTWICDP